MCNSRPALGLPVWLLAVLALAMSAAPAQAQFGMGMGMGMGWGWGMGGFNYTSSPSNYLQQWSLQNASRAGAPASNRPYANSPNAYFNNVRDNGYVPQYEVQRRRRPGQSVAVSTSPGRQQARTPAPAQAPVQVAQAAPKPVIPLASFFDAARKLVWPAEAPVAGDLQQKRDVSDEASLAVLDELKVRSYASLSSAADARQKLLDYGRPALQEIRAHATPRLADTFHLFLLSLYESLAQAAVPPSG